MASTESRTHVETVIRQLANNRQELAAHSLGMRRAASPADQLKRSFHEHKAVFIGSAVALGLLLSLLPERSKRTLDPAHEKTMKRHSDDSPEISQSDSKPMMAVVGVSLTKLLWDISKPFVKSWLSEKLLHTRKPLDPDGKTRSV